MVRSQMHPPWSWELFAELGYRMVRAVRTLMLGIAPGRGIPRRDISAASSKSDGRSLRLILAQLAVGIVLKLRSCSKHRNLS